jgi:hypothetical protein
LQHNGLHKITKQLLTTKDTHGKMSISLLLKERQIMTTMAIFNRAKKQHRMFKEETLRSKGYKFTTTERSRVAKQLYKMDKDARGRMCEFIVAEELRSLGFRVEMLDGNGKNDMVIKVGRLSYNVEIKSSLWTPKKDKTTNAYTMAAIKPQHFDILILIFVSPSGVEYRIISNEKFLKCFGKYYSYSNGHKCEGYSVGFTSKLKNKYECMNGFTLPFDREHIMTICNN